MNFEASETASEPRWTRIPWTLAAGFAVVVPLTALGVTRFRFPVLGVLAAYVLIAALLKKRAEGPWRWVPRVYLAVCLWAVARSWLVLVSVDPSAPVRALGAGLAAFLAMIAADRFSRRKGIASWGKTWLYGLAAAAAAAVAFRVSWAGLFENWGLIPGIFVAAFALRFRPGKIYLTLWTLCAAVMVYEWLGFMNLSVYTKDLERKPPAGVSVEVVQHGNPTGMPGARYFLPGTCRETKDAHYIGEGGKTYRLEADGTETVLFSGAESNQTLIEMCPEGLIVSGSFEQKFLMFSDLRTGGEIERVPLASHPTQIVLTPDRRDIYVGSSMPGMIFRVDAGSRKVTGVFDRFGKTDRMFSGICNILFLKDRIVGVWSSWYMADQRAGAVFSLDRDLDNFRTLGSFYGAWGFIAPGLSPREDFFLTSYEHSPVFRAFLDPNRGLTEIARLPRGHFYIVTMPDAGLVITNHWTTGEIVSFCANDPSRRFRLKTGGMGRMMHVSGNKLYTPSASGYLIVSFPKDICS